MGVNADVHKALESSSVRSVPKDLADKPAGFVRFGKPRDYARLRSQSGDPGIQFPGMGTEREGD